MKSENRNRNDKSKRLLCTILAAIMVVSVCAVIPAMGNGESTVTRSILPSTVSPGDELLVVVTFTAPENIDATIIDQLQDTGNWNMHIESGPSFYIVIDNTVWAYWPEPISSGSVIYRLTVPSDAAGDYYFRGELKWEGGNKNVTTTGDDHVTVTGVEEGSIAGNVREVDTSILPGATVELSKDTMPIDTDTTDANGNYTLSVSETGDYTVTVSKSGYVSETQDISIPAVLGEYTLDFVDNDALVPEDPTFDYVLDCIWLWKGEGLISFDKILDVIFYWKS